MSIDFNALRAPFPAERISWRIGSTTQDKAKGIALAYIDARDVMERLDEVCGPERWQCDYPHAGAKTVCRIGIRVGEEWIWKSNGAGDTDVEAEKGALSDAFKRAAVLWGIGQYLYDLGTTWVELEPKGRSHVIAAREESRLQRILVEHGAPPPRSSQSLKRTDATGKDEWAKLTEKLNNELLDCDTLMKSDKLRKAYRTEAKDLRWPRDWLTSLAGIFDAHDEKLRAAIEAAEAFPGDMPSKFQHPIMAGE